VEAQRRALSDAGDENLCQVVEFSRGKPVRASD
jgi:hypothetical protein